MHGQRPHARARALRGGRRPATAAAADQAVAATDPTQTSMELPLVYAVSYSDLSASNSKNVKPLHFLLCLRKRCFDALPAAGAKEELYAWRDGTWQAYNEIQVNKLFAATAHLPSRAHACRPLHILSARQSAPALTVSSPLPQQPCPACACNSLALHAAMATRGMFMGCMANLCSPPLPHHPSPAQARRCLACRQGGQGLCPGPDQVAGSYCPSASSV